MEKDMKMPEKKLIEVEYDKNYCPICDYDGLWDRETWDGLIDLAPPQVEVDISEVEMAFIDGYHHPETIRDYGSDHRVVNGLRNVMAYFVKRGLLSNPPQAAPDNAELSNALNVMEGIIIMNTPEISHDHFIGILNIIRSALAKQGDKT